MQVTRRYAFLMTAAVFEKVARTVTRAVDEPRVSLKVEREVFNNFNPHAYA